MAEGDYLNWLAMNTRTAWWHDSGDPEELTQGKAHGAIGVTTNPVLIYRALRSKPEYWSQAVKALSNKLSDTERTEALIKPVVQNAAKMFEPVYRETRGRHGYVCAQVDPAKASDREAMIATAKRFKSWATNIAVKFPVTAAGLDALEECVAEGITITATVSFTVPQVLAAAERHRQGAQRAKQKGLKPGRCFAVIMIGRLDDYLRDVVRDSKASVSEEDIIKAGLAVSKRAYYLYKKKGYEVTLLIAAMRGIYHITEMCGAELILSIHPKYQSLILNSELPREECIENPVDRKVIERLQGIPEFIKAYEPDGMKPKEFITYGVTQKTLSQFYTEGWSLLEALKLK